MASVSASRSRAHSRASSARRWWRSRRRPCCGRTEGTMSLRHCEQREAIQGREESLDCFALLAMTEKLTALHERRESVGVVLVPARQRRAVLDDVAGGPQDAPLVELAGDVIVGAEHVEIAGIDALDHEVDGLFGRPCAGRLLGAAARGEAREDEARNEQMRGDLAAGRV